PSLASLLTGAIDGRLADVHVALPGKVTAYENGRATVQPLIKRGYVGEDGERSVESLPAIPDVPVMFTGGAGIEVSVEPGDTVLLVFASASLDKWLALDKEVDPGDDRHHTLSDAIAIP